MALELSSGPGIYVKDYLVNSDAYSPLGMPEDGKSIAALLDAALRNWDGRVPLTVCPHASGTAGNAASERAAYPVTQVSITNYFCDFNCFLKNLQKLYKFSRKKFHVLFYVIKFLPVYPMYKPYNHLLQLRWHDGFFQIVYTHIQFKNFLSSFLILLSIAKLIHT